MKNLIEKISVTRQGVENPDILSLLSELVERVEKLEKIIKEKKK